ncbi:MAG: dihydrodipicolinate synthase family protein [Gemmataceae bacterium]|nr:dihydrodipicolinate synthase family protein [Gemmataceae bacterium]
MPKHTPHPFTGLVPAVLTPFDAAGELNLAAVEKQAALLLGDGVAAVFVGGTTGEFASLTTEERLALTRRWVEVAKGTPLRVVVHVGSNCLADSKALGRQAAELKAAAVAALAPSYFKPRSVEVLVDWCAEIAAAAGGLPFYFYDIPSMTGVTFPLTDFLYAAEDRIPNLAGAKFTNPDLTTFQHALYLRDGWFDVLWGTDEYLLAALTLGGAGAVGSSYNFLARHFHGLIADYEAGNLTAARAAQFRAVQVITTLFRYGYLSAAKELVRQRGVDLGGVRLPNGNLTAEQAAAFRTELDGLGLAEMIAG